jgi:hypothetical protein
LEENGGFKLMMFNLNHERLLHDPDSPVLTSTSTHRWYVAALATRNARVCLEEAMSAPPPFTLLTFVLVLTC